MRTHSSVAVCILLLAGGLSASPTSVLKGQVRDGRTGEPLVGASVVVNGTEYGNATDLNGDYVIVGLPEMTGTATAAYVGYDDTSASFTTTAESTTHLDFGLRIPLVQLNYVPHPPGPEPFPPKPTPLPSRPRPITLPVPARSVSRFHKWWGCESVSEGLLAIEQVSDSVLIQVFGGGMPGQPNEYQAGMREGRLSISEFQAFWDSLNGLSFWQLKNEYSGRAEYTGEEGGSISVILVDSLGAKTIKTVHYSVPRSCALEFWLVYDLFANMARYAPAAPDWRTLLHYDTALPITEFKDRYHSAALRAIAAVRDSQDLDTLLTMLLADNQYSGAAIAALGNIGSKRAVPALEKFLAMQAVKSTRQGARYKEGNAVAAAKTLIAVNGRQSLPAIRSHIYETYRGSNVYTWVQLLASIGDYMLVPDVVQILGDSSRYRREYVSQAAATLGRIGYKSQAVISSLFQETQRELNKPDPDNGTADALLSALRALTGQEFIYRPEDPLSVKRSNLAPWLRWWTAHASRFPAGRARANIQINSNPPDAEIWVDGAKIGETTPFVMFDVKAGKHNVRLAKDGYVDWSSTVTVTPERATNVNPVLSKDCGSLRVLSTPLAAAFLDGSSVGPFTPKLFDNIGTGKHRVRLFKLGYSEWDSMVTVTQGETTTVRATLKSAH